MEQPRISEADLQRINMNLMPPLLRELVKTVGMLAAFQLVEYRGGRRLYVPEIAAEDRALVQIIGLPALEKLVSKWGGKRLPITKMNKALMQLKHYMVNDFLEKNVPVSEIAETLDYSERRIFQLKATVREERNLDLFHGE